jgi:hypothetical protein
MYCREGHENLFDKKLENLIKNTLLVNDFSGLIFHFYSTVPGHYLTYVFFESISPQETGNGCKEI